MKTVQELANELGVTRQRVQQVIQSLPKEKQAKKEKGRLQITEQVEHDVKKAMNKDGQSKANKQTSKSELLVNLLKENNTTLKEENTFLKEQIKDLQIKLSQEQNLVRQQQKLIDQEQQLHLSDQKYIENIEEFKKTDSRNENEDYKADKSHTNKGFFKRFLGK